MDRWRNKIAVVTGASSGIGAACVRDLAKSGMVVVGLARRHERVLEIRESLPSELKMRIHAIKCDVTNEKDVIQAFQLIEKNLGGVDVLVNNAGIAKVGNLVEPNNTDQIKAVLDTNILGVVLCVREAFNSMKARKVDGHVVIVNSIVGHKIPSSRGISVNVYAPSKYAVTALVETYRQEFHALDTKVKVTSLSPGAVDTEIIPDFIRTTGLKMLQPDDISNAVLYIIGTPPNVQIHELTIKPMGEAI